MRPTFMRLRRPRDPFQDEINAALAPKLAKRLADAIKERAEAINAERINARQRATSGVSDADVQRILGVRDNG